MKKNTFVITALVLSALVGTQNAYALSTQLHVDDNVQNNSQTSSTTLHATTETNTNVSTEVKINAKSAAKLQTRLATSKEHADKEIDRRIKKMTEVKEKINALERLSANEKASLVGTLQTEIANLTTLKAKIDADTGTTILKTDIQSISKSYRIYMLILPQAHIAATADSIVTTTDTMATLGLKLQSRIAALQAAGKNTTTMTTLLADFNAKIADAKVQATAAMTAVASLTPDNGDKVMKENNTKAFATAKTDIKTAQTDLKAAREDASKIVISLKANGEVKVHATSTSATSTTTVH